MTSGAVGLSDQRVLPSGRTGRDRDEGLSASRAGQQDRLRVVVGDVDVLSRCGLASLLEGLGMSVVGQAADLGTLLDLVGSHSPGLVVLGQVLRAPMAEGVAAALSVREHHPDVGIVLLASHVQVEPAATLLAAGTGIGYLLRQRVSDVEEFVDTLHRVARGGSVVDPALVYEIVEARRHHDPLDALSPREREVLSQMAEGRSNYGIAKALWVTPGTVEKHVRSILAKLCLPDQRADHRRVLAVLTFVNSR